VQKNIGIMMVTLLFRQMKKIHVIFMASLLSLNFLAHAETVFTSTLKMQNHDIRLYTLDCGNIDIHDMTAFSSTGAYPHHAMLFSDPCFLIKHPDGWVLWDLGLGDQYLGHKFEDKKHQVGLMVSISLIDQLKQIDLKPDNIRYVILSHTHFDHTGNITLFPHTVFLMQKSEYQYIEHQGKPGFSRVDQQVLRILKNQPKILLNGDYDVFGDGTIKVLSTPGHTPGHESLEILLSHQGVIILSGDLYHTRKAYREKLIPVFNTSSAETLSSMNRINAILRNTHGRLIIQHDESDFSSLPKFPNYLD
jgi:N-acyl homoserine lactone hydrolase